MKSIEFIVERVDFGDGVMPLARYEVRQNVGDGRHKRFMTVIDGGSFLLDAMKMVVALGRKGVSSSDIKMVKITMYTDKEGTKHGKV